MKERGILFSAEMVRAILAGTKTQTRREVKLPAPTEAVRVDGPSFFCPDGQYVKAYRRADLGGPEDGEAPMHPRVYCPYGYPGDRLWVREAWRVHRDVDDVPGSKLTGHAIALRRLVAYEADRPMAALDGNALGRYRHARFMPRWASRITVEITDVRVQRLQDISEEDARAEGVDFTLPFGTFDVARLGFEGLWERINGDGSWDANPWVWALTFKRVAP